ncbi:peptidoglycan-binding protein [Streptomyces sp. NPDC059861]|uniref:peptidoglycan-binding domain-containing protein n=1 Tax=Streptomyces sp. NPDC059861 TaxID=3346974 RepID=UPI003657CA42
MQKRAYRRAVTAFALSASLLGGAAVVAPPASASTSQGVIYGTGVITDDWGDEGPLDYNSYDFSRATATWQIVLHLEGLYTGSIDCDFGPATTAATKAFQKRYGLAQDGSAGPATLSVADNFLSLESDGVNVDYKGKDAFQRRNGTYYIYSTTGTYMTAAYNSSSGCTL